MTDRRGFFGAALGGFAAALGLGRSAEPTVGLWHFDSSEWREVPLRTMVATEGWTATSASLKKCDIFTISGVYR